MQNKRITRALVIPVFLLVIPLIASQFVAGWNWTPSDYIFAYVLWAIAGLSYVLFTKNSANNRRVMVGLVVLFVLAFIWAFAATGFEGVPTHPVTLYLRDLLNI